MNADARPAPTWLITLTVNEFRRLFDALLPVTQHTVTSLLAWSRWRRRHQHQPVYPTTDDANTNDHELLLSTKLAGGFVAQGRVPPVVVVFVLPAGDDDSSVGQ